MAKDYIIQKAVEASKVKKGLLRPLNTYEQQAKSDGCCAILKFDENGHYLGAWSRTGEPAISMSLIGFAMADFEWEGEPLLPHYPESQRRTTKPGRFAGYAVIGEAWWPGKGEFNKISGDFRRQAPSQKLRFVINDVIPLEDFERGRCEFSYSHRVAEFRDVQEERFFFTDYWPAGAGDPQERCNQLVGLGGYDGLILRDPAGTWAVGRGTTGEIIKVKQKLSFDLRVLEVNEAVGEKTGRAVWKLVVDFRGQRLGVGSGVPFDRANVPNVGDIVEVEAMDYSSDGLLREPRFKGIRYDKLETD